MSYRVKEGIFYFYGSDDGPGYVVIPDPIPPAYRHLVSLEPPN